MKEIESKNNPIIKRAFKAINEPSKENLIVVEGHKLLNEALKSGAKPEMIFVACKENGLPRDLTTARNESYKINNFDSITYIISRGLIRELSTVQTPSDIIAFLTPSPAPHLDDVVKNSEMLVVLDRLQDPGNIGTIIRTSEAMGASAIILLNGCCNSNNHKVIRAAMGSSFRLPVIPNVDVKNLFNLLNKNNYMTICDDMKGTNIVNYKFSEKSALFIGQEGQGLSDYIIANCRSRIAIPMYGQVESLNVATSTAICLYEWSISRIP